MNSTNYSLSRRFTQQISRALRSWTEDPTEGYASSKLSLRSYEERRYFSIDELVFQTKFTRQEIQMIYRDFKQKCPRGVLNEKALAEVYSQYFGCGDCSTFAKHLYSALVFQHYSSHFAFVLQNTSKSRKPQGLEINFQQFLISLSVILKGSVEEKIRWIFSLYDLKKDGKITPDEVSSMINSIYDLMGQDVSPPVDESAKNKHIENVLKNMGLNSKDSSLSYDEFYKIFINHHQLIDSMMTFI